ncbi:hypothetical protein K3495_g817 [Podosphaera aphanis]|nr:hypothetical protein K3495_g817 [Podosphaera aphanis]
MALLAIFSSSELKQLNGCQLGQTKVFDNSNHYVSLETMMSTLRQTGAGQIETMGRAMKINGPSGSASEKPRGLDPNSRCELCRHPHNNSECYKQHPELAPKSKFKKRRGKKGKAKVSAGNEIFHDKDNSDDDGVSLANVAKISSANLKNKNPLPYVTGASHHFIRVKENFIALKKLSYPFEFDQAKQSANLS